MRKLRNYPFKWILWRKINDSLNDYIDLNKLKRKEAERWHLREFHSQSRINFLARYLKNLSSIKTEIEVKSTWVDQYPKAEFSINNGPKKYVELADLLLVVTLCKRTVLQKKAAILLQAKCSSSCSQFDNSQDPSTVDERDLIESCDWPITVKSSRNGTLINPNNNGYTLKPTNGLLGYASYLLIPNKEDINDLPYNLLLPISRVANNGATTHFSEAMKSLILQNNPKFGGPMNGSSPDWDLLIDDLINYVKNTPNLQRFSKSTVYGKPPISKVLTAVAKRGIGMAWFLPVLHRFNVLPDGSLPTTPLDPNPNDEDGGFTLLEITVNSEDESFEFLN